MLSLSDLDVTKKSNEGFEFELTDEAGKPIGVYLTVIGAHSQPVQQFVANKLNARRREEALAERRGKKPDMRPIEEDIEFANELAAARIVGWRGISDEYSAANALRLVSTNPNVKEQVLRESENLSNFMKLPAKT